MFYFTLWLAKLGVSSLSADWFQSLICFTWKKFDKDSNVVTPALLFVLFVTPALIYLFIYLFIIYLLIYLFIYQSICLLTLFKVDYKTISKTNPIDSTLSTILSTILKISSDNKS